MTKIIVDGKYTYQTSSKVSVGDTAVLPTPYWLREVKGDTWNATVTAIGSDYQGHCASVVRIIRKRKKVIS